ncbi:MAG: AmmeMemoRadiSam system protein B [Phycisphaerales bacterium]|nr:AmmeMemoRadiSam system protein B [Phycisphaerae bacterium]NNF41928.1 AmmeMemoRadiSam system protein B [Phycisphaerales bacterium]NNM26394.1 AmmeMemoRadiSam system protein B [Phycisphaerales bacterium]
MSADLPDHILRPHLRPIQPVPLQKDGRNFVALRDPSMLQKQTMVVPAEAMRILQQFHGQDTLDELANKFRSKPEQLIQLAQGLDTLGLLWGPTFEQMERARWDKLKEEGAFPPLATGSLGETAEACRETIKGYFDETEDPEIEETVLGIIAPHLDYARGWPNYAAAYYPLLDSEPPDRVVVFGTNHFGLGDGVVLTEFGFESPMGRCPSDEAMTGKLVESLGKPVIVDQLDHMPEHSIELQIPWIQYCWGDVPIVAALIPDPLSQMINDDDERVGGPQFIEALSAALDELGGRTMFVGSCDLSHVGPQFGEPRPVDDQRRVDVERHDRDMMRQFVHGDPEEFLSALRWNKNPTRWCSIGSMSSMLKLVGPERVELIDYRQAFDERGLALVSCAAFALV